MSLILARESITMKLFVTLEYLKKNLYEKKRFFGGDVNMTLINLKCLSNLLTGFINRNCVPQGLERTKNGNVDI